MNLVFYALYVWANIELFKVNLATITLSKSGLILANNITKDSSSSEKYITC